MRISHTKKRSFNTTTCTIIQKLHLIIILFTLLAATFSQQRVLSSIKNEMMDKIDSSISLQGKTVAEPKGEKYLLFYNHAGFSNQILSLSRAANLAVATNRTLVLPPLLPHFTATKAQVFKGWEARAAGRYVNNQEINLTITDTKRATRESFPSFLEIIDFASFDVPFLDMPQFSKRYDPRKIVFSTQHKNLIGYNRTTGETNSFEKVVDIFTTTHGNEPFAVIGSAFKLYRADSPISEDEISAFPLSEKLLCFLHAFYEVFPSKQYAGVHIRFPDSFKNDTCDIDMVSEAYDSVLDTLRGRGIANGTHVIIGNSNKVAKKCFVEASNGIYPTFTINEVIEDNAILQQLITEIKLEPSLVLSILDQLLIALADEVALTIAGHVMSQSTFHRVILGRHRRRDVVLSKLDELSRSNSCNRVKSVAPDSNATKHEASYRVS